MLENHDLPVWRPELFQGQMVLNHAGSKQVICIDSGEVTDQKRRTHFICRVKDCFQVPGPDAKDLAIRTIVKSEAQNWLALSGNSDTSGKRACVSVLAPDTEKPFRLLKMIHNHGESTVCYNCAHQVIKPQKYVNEINAQCIPSQKQRPADLCCTSTLAAAPRDLPGRLEDVKSIDTVVDYVAGEHHPLVIFDVDDTLITRDILKDGTTGQVPVAKNTAEIMAKIRQKSPDSEIILLTQASKKKTLVKLREAGISPELFNSIESVADKGGDKGIALKACVRNMRQKPDQVCFIDDCAHFLSLVEKASKDLRIRCNTFHFTGAKEAVIRVKANALGCTVEEYKRRFQPP